MVMQGNGERDLVQRRAAGVFRRMRGRGIGTSCLIAYISLLIILLNTSTALAYCVAYEGAECHEKITDKAFDLIVLKDNNTDFKDPVSNSDYKSAIRKGSSDEDGDWPHNRVFNHWLNPLNGAGMPFYNNAANWSVSPNNDYNWQNAINKYYYSSEQKKEAYEILGHTVHLIQDMSVPAHTHIDLHGPGSNEDYEDYVKNHSNIIDQIPVNDLFIIKNLNNNRQSFFYELAKYSYYRNRYPADLSDAKNPKGKLTEMYPNSTKLTYTSFLSYWKIDGVGLWWETDVVGFESDWWETVHEPENKEHGTEVPGWYYIENTDPNPPSPPLIEKSKWYPDNPEMDEYNYSNVNGYSIAQIYAEQLLPLAVDYSAGLIQFYYSIVNHPPYVQRVKVTQVKDGIEKEKYEQHWKDNGENNPSRKLIDDLTISEDERVIRAGEGDLKIEIEFSEPVKDDVKVNLGSDIEVNGKLLDNNKTIWVGHLIIDPANPSLDGEQTIEITATDPDEHFDGIGGDLDADPTSKAKRYIQDVGIPDEYDWINYEINSENSQRNDINHKIKIVSIRSPLTSINIPYYRYFFN